MTKHVFFIVAMLFYSIASSYGHEIYLKNGKIITSDSVWIEKGIVNFEQYGGVISIPRNRVKEIVYRESSAEKRDTTQELYPDIQVAPLPSPENLAERLEAKLLPKNPLEKASICTLALKTDSGFGSGFFISENGYIITNKHVVRGDKEKIRQKNEEYEQYLKVLKETKKQLDNEYEMIVKKKAALKRDYALLYEYERKARTDLDRRYLKSQRIELNDFKKYLVEIEKNHKIVKKEYQIEKQEVEKQFNNFKREQNRQTFQTSFEIVLIDDTTLNAKLIKVSTQHDLALLKVSGYQTPYLKSVLPSDLSQGQNVYALGSPLSLSMKNTITSGVLSSFREDYIQTNAQIYPGNSGGPLINENGKVIGILTMRMVSNEFQGPGFAIPISVALAEFNMHL